jgi:hypothetical protein
VVSEIEADEVVAGNGADVSALNLRPRDATDAKSAVENALVVDDEPRPGVDELPGCDESTSAEEDGAPPSSHCAPGTPMTTGILHDENKDAGYNKRQAPEKQDNVLPTRVSDYDFHEKLGNTERRGLAPPTWQRNFDCGLKVVVKVIIKTWGG